MNINCRLKSLYLRLQDCHLYRLLLILNSIDDVSQIDGSINYNLCLYYKWHDYQLVWDNKNISKLSFNTDPKLETSIWTPNIYPVNSLSTNLDYTRSKVDYNGDVIWRRPGFIKSSCSFNLKYYPYDEQHCTLKLESWENNIDELCIIKDINDINLNLYNGNDEWELTDLKSNDHNLEITNRINEMSLNNVFFIDIEPILNLLLSYNLIEQYSIKKIYPNSINIFILPTKFIAKIKNKNGVFMIGNNGKLIKTQEIDKDLPLLYGKFDSKYFLEFYNSIIQSEFKYNEIESILYFPSRRWEFKLKDETLIKLPSNNLTKSLKLAYLIKKKKNKSIKIIDLRIKTELL